MPRSAIVLAAGAVIYALAVGALGVTFDATPLLVGLVVLAAATVGGVTRLGATGLTLIGWGVAVLLTRHGPLPDEREAATFLVGAGLGLVAARVISRMRPGLDLGEGSTALVAGGLAFFVAFDVEWIYDWPVWAAALAAWAAWEVVRSRRRAPG